MRGYSSHVFPFDGECRGTVARMSVNAIQWHMPLDGVYERNSEVISARRIPNRGAGPGHFAVCYLPKPWPMACPEDFPSNWS
jgi:hypothetical protein